MPESAVYLMDPITDDPEFEGFGLVMQRPSAIQGIGLPLTLAPTTSRRKGGHGRSRGWRRCGRPNLCWAG